MLDVDVNGCLYSVFFFVESYQQINTLEYLGKDIVEKVWLGNIYVFEIQN